MPDRRTAKRGTAFTCQFIEMTLAAGGQNTAGQQITDLGPTLITKLSRGLNNMTLVHSWVNGWWTQTVGASTPVWSAYTLAMVRANVGMDAGDFGAIAEHTGDIVSFDCRALLESEATDDVLFPRTESKVGSGVYMESRGQRKFERIGDTLWLIAQKNTVTEQSITFRCAVTLLWKLPS